MFKFNIFKMLYVKNSALVNFMASWRPNDKWKRSYIYIYIYICCFSFYTVPLNILCYIIYIFISVYAYDYICIFVYCTIGLLSDQYSRNRADSSTNCRAAAAHQQRELVLLGVYTNEHILGVDAEEHRLGVREKNIVRDIRFANTICIFYILYVLYICYILYIL